MRRSDFRAGKQSTDLDRTGQGYMYIKRPKFPCFDTCPDVQKQSPFAATVIPTTRLHFFIRLELQLRLLRTAVVASHNVEGGVQSREILALPRRATSASPDCFPRPPACELALLLFDSAHDGYGQGDGTATHIVTKVSAAILRCGIVAAVRRRCVLDCSALLAEQDWD